MAGVNDGLPKGLLPVMLTPFTEDGSAVDYEGLTHATPLLGGRSKRQSKGVPTQAAVLPRAWGRGNPENCDMMSRVGGG